MARQFDEKNHANVSGWATYHDRENQRGKGWRRLICDVLGHPFVPTPETPNGYSPNNYGTCRRCGNWIKWFRVGQHRKGGMDRG